MNDLRSDFDRLIDEVEAFKLGLASDGRVGRLPTRSGSVFDRLRFARDGRGGFAVEPDLFTGLRPDDPRTLALGSILDFYRRKKRKKYQDHIAAGYAGLRCVAEGDSWFELPPIGYSTDIIRELWDEYAILSLAKAGDAWESVLRQDELFATVAEEEPDVVLLSVGGNNVLGQIETFVHHWSPTRPKDAYLNEEFQYELNKIAFYTEHWVSRLVNLGCDVVMHGYGYAEPRPADRGGWLIGGPLSRERNINDQTIWSNVVIQMVDLFNDRIKSISSRPKYAGKFHFLDLRNDVGKGPDWWEDEIHLTQKGYEAVASRFRVTLEAIAARDAGT